MDVWPNFVEVNFNLVNTERPNMLDNFPLNQYEYVLDRNIGTRFIDFDCFHYPLPDLVTQAKACP